jgi:integrase
VAATLDFFCGLRACEIKRLQWKHISFEERRLSGPPVENSRRLARSLAERHVR